MCLSKRLVNIKDCFTDRYQVKTNITGIVYDTFPKPPYQTDIFFIKDRAKDIQYEVYSINVNGKYEIIELIKVTKDKILSSVRNKIMYDEISKEILTLLKIV